MVEKQTEKRYRAIVENRTEMICCFLQDGTLTFVNEAYCRYFNMNREELIGHKFLPLIPDEDREKVFESISTLNPKKPIFSHEHRVLSPSGEVCWNKWTNRAIFDNQNKLVEYQAVGWDITNRKKAEEALKKAHDELERRVEERTEELKIKTKSLEELNTAMKVLLEKRKEDKIKLEDNVLANIRELIVPMFDKLNNTKLDAHQKMMVNIIESNLSEITSSFVQKLSMKYLSLTPTELKIANYIKHGTTTKKIAELMQSSPRTIETHRKNIRKKIGLDKKSKNLRSYLISLH